MKKLNLIILIFLFSGCDFLSTAPSPNGSGITNCNGGIITGNGVGGIGNGLGGIGNGNECPIGTQLTFTNDTYGYSFDHIDYVDVNTPTDENVTVSGTDQNYYINLLVPYADLRVKYYKDIVEIIEARYGDNIYDGWVIVEELPGAWGYVKTIPISPEVTQKTYAIALPGALDAPSNFMIIESLTLNSDNDLNEIMDTFRGLSDTDGDGDLDGIDFSELASCYNHSGPPRELGCPDYRMFDYNVDGRINDYDVWVFNKCYGESGNTVFASCFQVIPEMWLNVPNMDIDGDGDLDGEDYSAFASCYSTGEPRCDATTAAKFDINGDGKVDAEDFEVFEFCYTGAGGDMFNKEDHADPIRCQLKHP